MIALVNLLIWALAIFTGGYVAYSTMTDRQKQQLISSVTNSVRGALLGAALLLDDVAGVLRPIASAFTAGFNRYGGPIADDLRPARKARSTNFSTSREA